MPRDEEVDCGYFEVVATTDDALKVTDRYERNAWIPKSAIGGDSDLGVHSEVGDEGDLFLPETLALDKGLI